MKKLKMKKNLYDGKLITFCGLDGCGKTTLIKKLADSLSKTHKIFLTRQPTDVVRSSEIFRTYMDEPDHSAFDYRSLSLLAASDRIQHVSNEISEALARGETVISDRYFYSCLANLRARGYKKDAWIYEISENIIKPDLAFFLDIPVSIAIERIRMRESEKNRYIDLPLQYRLRQEYIDICRKNKGIFIDTRMSENVCFLQIKSAADRLYGNEEKNFE